MANEVDAAQGRGEVARRDRGGANIGVQGSDTVHTFTDLGFDRRRVAEWRVVRDAGEQSVEAAIRSALNAGRAPSKKKRPPRGGPSREEVKALKSDS